MNKLYRSRDNKVIAGVCGGLSNYFGIDVTIIRILTLLLIFVGGVSVWIYIIAAIVMPLEPKNNDYNDKKFISDDSFKDDFKIFKEKSYVKKNKEEDFY